MYQRSTSEEGRWYPKFVPDASDATADYTPGIWHSPHGVVYGMYIPQSYVPPQQLPSYSYSPASVFLTQFLSSQPGANHFISPPPLPHMPAPHSALHNAFNVAAPNIVRQQPPQPPQPVVVVPQVTRRASFMRRTCAELIDLIFIATVLLMFAGGMLEPIIQAVEAAHLSDTALEMLVYKEVEKFIRVHLVPSYVLMMLIEVSFCVITGGATLGKLVCGLRVVQYPSHEKPTFFQYVGRAIAKSLSWALLPFIFLTIIVWDHTFHCVVSKTRVVCIRR